MGSEGNRRICIGVSMDGSRHIREDVCFLFASLDMGRWSTGLECAINP